MKFEFTEVELDRIIEMAWEDRTPFEAILFQFKLAEKDVIKLMRATLKESSFKRWRKRVNSGVSQKHLKREIQKLTDLNVVDKKLLVEIELVNDNENFLITFL